MFSLLKSLTMKRILIEPLPALATWFVFDALVQGATRLFGAAPHEAARAARC
ncbi:hypothetical protein [Piscinibacter sp.]|jgi:hypothetical protein|uniref:hypothetical protein n=1 Tax=Piscinibacter sp. TaxID=1903157 RepID=UPI00355983CB